jgi:hypothetical protein
MTYIFYRKNGFYSLELKNDKEAIKNAKINEGTIKVTDLNLKIIYEM